MVWGIKDEYFEKVYGKSHKSKSRTSLRRIRPEKTEQSNEEDATLPGGALFRNSGEQTQELQSELHLKKDSDT
jgi:hypothetical protein